MVWATAAIMVMLLLFDDILQQAVSSLASNRHIAVLFELGVVAFRLLTDTVAE